MYIALCIVYIAKTAWNEIRWIHFELGLTYSSPVMEYVVQAWFGLVWSDAKYQHLAWTKTHSTCFNGHSRLLCLFLPRTCQMQVQTVQTSLKGQPVPGIFLITLSAACPHARILLFIFYRFLFLRKDNLMQDYNDSFI